MSTTEKTRNNLQQGMFRWEEIFRKVNEALGQAVSGGRRCFLSGGFYEHPRQACLRNRMGTTDPVLGQMEAS